MTRAKVTGGAVAVPPAACAGAVEGITVSRIADTTNTPWTYRRPD
jgi:hypothetical protein